MLYFIVYGIAGSEAYGSSFPVSFRKKLVGVPAASFLVPRTKWELESNAFCIPSPLAPPPTPLPPSISMCAETRKHNSGPSLLLPPSRATLYPRLVAVFLEARVGVVDSLIRFPGVVEEVPARRKRKRRGRMFCGWVSEPAFYF